METRERKQVLLAQNFLKSRKLIHRLVMISNIGLSDTVYEIGPGNGMITRALAGVAGHVIAIEKDPKLACRLRKRFYDVENVSVVEKDFLKYSFSSCPPTAGYRVFANIPYNCTAQIVRKILHERPCVSEAYLIMQKEPARKFSGCPRETLFSILAKPFFDFQILMELRRTDFWPIPNVDSVFLSIKRRARPLIETQDAALYREFVRYGFASWKPNLKLAFKRVFTYKQWKHLARELDFPLNARPTELSVEQWISLYQAFRQR